MYDAHQLVLGWCPVRVSLWESLTIVFTDREDRGCHATPDLTWAVVQTSIRAYMSLLGRGLENGTRWYSRATLRFALGQVLSPAMPIRPSLERP